MQEKKKELEVQFKKQQEYDQREKATQETKSSKVNSALKPYGAEKGVFKAPEPRKGG